MATNKKHISPENITEWLASTGFLFPRNESELKRFEELYGDTDFGLTGKEIDPDKIIDGTFVSSGVIPLPSEINIADFTMYRMAARNGKAMPEHILNKIKMNQENHNNDPGTEESKS